nr:hypothetical protein [Conexibacter sp. DBS9H8]
MISAGSPVHRARAGHIRPVPETPAQRLLVSLTHILNEDDLTIAQLEVDLIAGLKPGDVSDCLGDHYLTLLTDPHSHTLTA